MHKQVAIIDIGSSCIRGVIGERGINNTFLIKSRFDYSYEGYSDGEFFDVESVKDILHNLSNEILKASNNKIKKIYVGVPSDFINVVVKDSQISFENKKRIKEDDLESLFDGAFVLKTEDKVLINRSAIVYELDDFRRLANPIGAASRILKGKLSFVLCEKYFYDLITNELKKDGFKYVECVSTTLAESLYLTQPEDRDRILMFADVGYISSSFSIIQGDGIIFHKTFSFGGGYITAGLTEKFDLDFNVAENLKRKINLSSITTSTYDIIECENGEYFPLEDVKNVITYTLDTFCENVFNAIEDSKYSIPEYVPLLITGGGVNYLRGAKEYISNRIGQEVKSISPNVPMMNKPTESAILSLLDLALSQ